MEKSGQQLGEEFVKLALAIEEHLPGYVDSYFGVEEWKSRARQDGKLPLPDLSNRVDQLTKDISQADGLDAQRRDFLARQVTAMQMSLRLLTGEKVSLAEEVLALYDVEPSWKNESHFEEAQKKLNDILPAGNSINERMQAWNHSLEISIEQVKDLLPIVLKKLRDLTRSKFDLPEDESFTLEFVTNQPWSAYNWYLGNYKSRIDINTDLPAQVNYLAGLIAHEGYPGHHTELSIKEEKLIGQKNYLEHTLTLINSPSCVISEGIATTALRTIISDNELEDWYREEILPRAGLSPIDAKIIMQVRQATQEMAGLAGNTAFMLHDQKKSESEISLYLQKYGMYTEREAEQSIRFISNPLYRSYIFTYHVGSELLEKLFSRGDRISYFKRILEEPVTPHQIRQWINE